MVEWEDKFSVGVLKIDEEHKKLIDIMNNVIAAKQRNDDHGVIRKILDEMVDYANIHFKTEETYMLKFKYPEYSYHKEEHLDFTFKTLAYQSRVLSGDLAVATEILEYLQLWLFEHIQRTDKKYTECFNTNGIK
jgi:hemerythrin-like metal-binding protein